MFKKVILKSFAGFLSVYAITTTIAGTYLYWQGLVFALMVGFAIFLQSLIFERNADLAHERRHPGPGVKKWDWVFMVVYTTFIFGTFIVGVLDSSRFFWTLDFSIWLYLIGYAFGILGIIGFFWSMSVNNWFATVVRIQKERNHRVTDVGPYRFVRHPGYVGMLLMSIAIPLEFGSWFAFIPAILSMFAIIIRTALEDATLERELSGYKDYSSRVRFRLVPWIW